jgi:DHA3 family macrolide efflux protein-like MFS transporter
VQPTVGEGVTETRHGSSSIWKNRNLLILVGGQWVSQIGNAVFSMAMYWFVLQRTGSRADLGFAGSILSLAGIAGLAAGAFVDRWDRRRTMAWTDAIRAVLAFALVGAALVRRLDVVAVVGVAFAISLLGTLFTPAEQALVPSVVDPAHLTEANAVNQGAGATAQLAGAAFGGLILGAFGPVVLFGLNGLSFVVSVASLALLQLPRLAHSAATPRPGGGGSALWREILEGQHAIWGSAFLRRIVPMSLIINFAMAPINYLDVAWVRQVLHLGAFVYGLVGVAILVGMLFGSVVAARVHGRFAYGTLVPASLFSAGGAIFAFSRLPFVVPDLACLALFGVLVGVLNTIGSTVIQQATPDQLRGRVFGTLVALVTLANPLGALLAGLAAAALPLGTVFAATGVLTALASFLGLGLPAEIRVGAVATGS